MIDVELAAFVTQIIVFDILVLLLLLGLRHIGGLLEGLLVCKGLPPKGKLRIWTQLLNHKLALLSQHSSSALDCDLEDVEVQSAIVGDAPADHHFEQAVYLCALDAIVHEEEVVDEVSKLLHLLVGLPEIALED
jgi:hypothetical protein